MRLVLRGRFILTGSGDCPGRAPQDRLLVKVSIVPDGYTAFKHLVKGYDAGYYGYLCSKFFAADTFKTVFSKDPMNAKEGRRYRHVVLEKGGSQDVMKMLLRAAQIAWQADTRCGARHVTGAFVLAFV